MASSPAASGTLWLIEDPEPPLADVVRAYRRRGHGTALIGDVAPRLAGRATGRVVTVRPPREQRDYGVTVRLVSPRVLIELCRRREDVVIVQELNLIALYAVLSKLVRRRAVVALIEGDLRHAIGPRGSAAWKVAFRRVVARWVDAFLANSSVATRYLVEGLGVPAERVVEDWWLAGFEDGRGGSCGEDGERPLFVAVGRLVPPKGFDLLIEAFARFRDGRRHGRLVIAGDGEQRRALEGLATRLGVADAVEFRGQLAREEVARLLAAADLLVLPSFTDLVGRVVVEALSLGTPVAASDRSGAAEVLVRHGENGLVFRASDVDELTATLHAAAQPERLAQLRAGARDTSPRLVPDVAAQAVERAVEHARARRL